MDDHNIDDRNLRALPSSTPTETGTPTPPTITPTSTIFPSGLPVCGSSGVILDLPLNSNNAVDMSGCNHGVTTTNTVPELDRHGNSGGALRFGANSHIEIANSALLDMDTASYTLAAWVKFDTTAGAQRVFSKGSSYCTQHPGYMLRTNGASMLQEFTCSQGSSGTCDLGKTGQVNLSTGVWHYVVNTVERGGQGKIYIDGALDVGSVVSNIPSCTLSNGRSMFIGYNPDLPTEEQFYGVIDDVKIIRGVVWSDSDISQLFKTESSATHTMTPSNTVTVTTSDSPSVSSSPTFTASLSGSFTPTNTASPTRSSSGAITPSITDTSSISPTTTLSATPSFTGTATATSTTTATETITTSGSATPSTTCSVSVTNTASSTNTMSPSVSTSTTFIPSSSVSNTDTPTYTATPTSTDTSTGSPSDSSTTSTTASGSNSSTHSATESPTTTVTITPSVTPTLSITPTESTSVNPTLNKTQFCYKNGIKGESDWKDFNGDGKVDLVCEHYDNSFEVCLSTSDRELDCLGELAFIYTY